MDESHEQTDEEPGTSSFEDANLDESDQSLVENLDDSTPEIHPRTSLSALGLLGLLAGIWGIELMIGVVVFASFYILSGEFDPEAIPFSLVLLITMLSWVSALVLCAVVGCRRFGVSLSTGFAAHKVETGVIKKAVLCGVGYSVIASIVLATSVDETELSVTQMIQENASNSWFGIPWLYCAFALIVPPLEELYYRGFLLRSLGNLIPTSAAAVLLVLWFGFTHAFQLSGSIPAILVILILGSACMYLRIKYQSVMPGIAFHLSYNLALVIFTIVSLLVSGSPEAG